MTKQLIIDTLRDLGINLVKRLDNPVTSVKILDFFIESNKKRYINVLSNSDFDNMSDYIWQFSASDGTNTDNYAMYKPV